MTSYFKNDTTTIRQPNNFISLQPNNDITAVNDVNLKTQFSFNDANVSGDSTIKSTSTQQLFTCQTNINSFGNLSFPLRPNYENFKKYNEKSHWQDLLVKLKSQSILKDMKVFHNIKNANYKNNKNLQKFPLITNLNEKVIDKFPIENESFENVQDFQLLKRKLKLNKKSKFPLKIRNEKDKFLASDLEKSKTVLKLKKSRKLDLNFVNNLKATKKFSKSLKLKKFQKFPCYELKDYKLNKQFPLNENKDIKFPQIFQQKPENFPLDYKFLSKSNISLNSQNKSQLEIQNILKPIKNLKTYVSPKSKESVITKFPSENVKGIIQFSRFPLQSQNAHIIDLNKQYEQQEQWHKINNNSNNIKTTFSTSTSSSSLSMTQFCQNIDNEHVSQVQDAQNCTQENPLTPAVVPRETIKIPEPIQTPPQTTLAKTTSDGDDENKDVFILATINSINNTHPNEKVNVYVEKIELIQNAIVALFETMLNAFKTNHNREEKHLESNNIGSSNAIQHGHEHDNDENAARFALTPPTMSVTTSVRSNNNERNEHSKEDLHYSNNINNKTIYAVDLGDLYDREVVGGQIVERYSDVRDTLAEAVDNAVTNNTPNRTGSFLVKSEEPISPYSPLSPTLKESIDTSSATPTDYTKDIAELLPKENNVFAVNIEREIDVKNNLEYDSTNETIDRQNIKLNDIIRSKSETLENKKCINFKTSEKVREMTVTRLAESNGHDTTNDNNNHLQIHEALEHKNDILTNDLEIDEMKYEMNKVKGALPSSSLTDRTRLGKYDSNLTGSVTGSNHYGRNNATNSTRLNTDTALGNSRLPTSLSSTRHYNDSSYTPRSSSAAALSSSPLKTDSASSLTHTPTKRSSVHTHLPQDSVSHRTTFNLPSSLHDTSSQRPYLNTFKPGNETALKSATDTTNDRSKSKILNDHSSETSTKRRPSLGSLRNTQSNSLVSVDLPHYTPSSTAKSHEPSSTLNKANSIDISTGGALSERTRLRRQRQLRSQDSQDEQEDPIERLNRLKARISASLSEVKGVLKQYSTEENDNETKEEEQKKPEEPIKFRFVKKIRRRSVFADDEAAEKEPENNKDSLESKVEQVKEGKDETDNVKLDNATTLPDRKNDLKEIVLEKPKDNNKEEAGKNLEAKETKLNKQLYTLKEENHENLQNYDIKPETEISEKLEEQTISEVHKLNEQEKQVNKKEEALKAKNDMTIKNQAELKHKNDPEIVKEGNQMTTVKNQEQCRDKNDHSLDKEEKQLKSTNDLSIVNEQNDLKLKNEIQNVKHEEQLKAPKELHTIKEEERKYVLAQTQQKNEIQTSKQEDKLKTPNELQTIREEGESKSVKAKPLNQKHEIQTDKQEEQLKVTNELQTINEEEENKGAIAKPPLHHHNKHETKSMENTPTPDNNTKVKKRIVIKPKDPTRRASLAAVEGSKIEPPVKVAIPAKIHRRPSDSEAVVKKKLITAKINTSGIVEEVTPKPKIVKVKKSLTKNNTNSQLATTQLQAKDEEEIKTNDKSNEQEKDNKSIVDDKNKDVLMPKHTKQQQQHQPQQQQQQKQEQEQKINNQITSQKNLLLPTQLVIDETASSNLKTIENSVLQPKEQKQQQQQYDHHKEEENKKQATTIQPTTTNFKSNDLQTGGTMLENLTTALSSSTTSEANGQNKRENNVQQKDNLHDLLQQETTIIPQTTTKTNDEKKQQTTELKDLLLKQQTTEKFQEKLENQQDQQQQPQIQQQKEEKSLAEQVVTTTDLAIVKSENLNKKDEGVKVSDSFKEPCIDKTPTSTHDAAEHQKQQQPQPHNQLPVEGEQTSITHIVADTKTISSPLNSISTPTDITVNTTTVTTLNSSNNTEIVVDENITKAATQLNTMPELNLAPAPVQTAEIIPHPEVHKKKSILKKVIRQTSQDKAKKSDINLKQPVQDANTETEEKLETEIDTEVIKDDLTEECSESTEVSETTTSEEVAATPKPKKERKVKKKVIIKRQKRRLSIGDSFFHPGDDEEPQNSQIETLEKPIAYVSDDEDGDSEEQEETSKEEEAIKKPLKSCIMHKEYNIGDQVLYAERFKKTQIKWRRGRIKERITSISYLLDIDGKDVSSHINYLKKWTGRKVRFSGKEYLEIDYEQLAEEEERAERLQRRTYSIWNMV